MFPRILVAATLFFFFLFHPIPNASAQWVQQTVALKEGWNSVFLEVEPYPAQCRQLLKGMPIQTVTTYDPDLSSVEFIQNPAELTPDLPDWRFYFPVGDPREFSNNLHAFQANTPYLIQCSEPVIWKVVGKPVFSKQEWRPDSYNFVGFHVDPNQPPTLEDWFSASVSHQPLDLWKLDSDGDWQKVYTTNSTALQSGEAYWVYTNGQSDFQGPVKIDLPQGRELDFARGLVEQDIDISIIDGFPRTIAFERLSSVNAPDLDLPQIAGPVPLSIFKTVQDGETTRLEYVDLPTTVDFTGIDSISRPVQIAVDRNKMGNAPEGFEFQSLLEITDGQGFRRCIGVSSENRQRVSKNTSAKGVGAVSIDPNAGLWVGDVVLKTVDEVDVSPTSLTPTATEFEFRVMLHVDEDGTVRLLNEVIQLYREGSTHPDPTNPDLEVVDEPGRYVLVTPSAPDSVMNEIGKTLLPATLRDGREFARRISTAAYTLIDENGNAEEPVVTSIGSFGATGASIEANLKIADSDPNNPFHHQYHPQHRYPKPGENFPDWTIDWNMEFTFTADPPDGVNTAGWGDTQLGGTYRQEIEGLANDTIVAGGYFKLQRASPVPVLNDGVTN
ncbi:MAG: hypothetical protein KC944_19330 [Candidatus Omnitrophica bacterium]|nr:hypothetical protein [Candidatus Omnitrophota bacterium]